MMSKLTEIPEFSAYRILCSQADRQFKENQYFQADESLVGAIRELSSARKLKAQAEEASKQQHIARAWIGRLKLARYLPNSPQRREETLAAITAIRDTLSPRSRELSESIASETTRAVFPHQSENRELQSIAEQVAFGNLREARRGLLELNQQIYDAPTLSLISFYNTLRIGIALGSLLFTAASLKLIPIDDELRTIAPYIALMGVFLTGVTFIHRQEHTPASNNIAFTMIILMTMIERYESQLHLNPALIYSIKWCLDRLESLPFERAKTTAKFCLNPPGFERLNRLKTTFAGAVEYSIEQTSFPMIRLATELDENSHALLRSLRTVPDNSVTQISPENLHAVHFLIMRCLPLILQAPEGQRNAILESLQQKLITPYLGYVQELATLAAKAKKAARHFQNECFIIATIDSIPALLQLYYEISRRTSQPLKTDEALLNGIQWQTAVEAFLRFYETQTTVRAPLTALLEYSTSNQAEIGRLTAIQREKQRRMAERDVKVAAIIDKILRKGTVELVKHQTKRAADALARQQAITDRDTTVAEVIEAVIDLSALTLAKHDAQKREITMGALAEAAITAVTERTADWLLERAITQYGIQQNVLSGVDEATDNVLEAIITEAIERAITTETHAQLALEAVTDVVIETLLAEALATAMPTEEAVETPADEAEKEDASTATASTEAVETLEPTLETTALFGTWHHNPIPLPDQIDPLLTFLNQEGRFAYLTGPYLCACHLRNDLTAQEIRFAVFQPPFTDEADHQRAVVNLREQLSANHFAVLKTTAGQHPIIVIGHPNHNIVLDCTWHDIRTEEGLRDYSEQCDLLRHAIYYGADQRLIIYFRATVNYHTHLICAGRTITSDPTQIFTLINTAAATGDQFDEATSDQLIAYARELSRIDQRTLSYLWQKTFYTGYGAQALNILYRMRDREGQAPLVSAFFPAIPVPSQGEHYYAMLSHLMQTQDDHRVTPGFAFGR